MKDGLDPIFDEEAYDPDAAYRDGFNEGYKAGQAAAHKLLAVRVWTAEELEQATTEDVVRMLNEYAKEVAALRRKASEL